MANGAMSVSLMKPSLICSFSGPLPAATAEAQRMVDATSAKSLITLTSPDDTWRVCAGGVKQSLCQRFFAPAAPHSSRENAATEAPQAHLHRKLARIAARGRKPVHAQIRFAEC